MVDDYDTLDLVIETNELLNIQYLDLIQQINLHDAPDSPSNNEYLTAEYEKDQFDVYIKSANRQQLDVAKSPDNTAINKNEVQPCSRNNNDHSYNENRSEFVKYGRGWVKKHSDAYHDMRKRNNEAIHKCRKNKGAKRKETDKVKNLNSCNEKIGSGERKEIIQELVKEICFLKNFLDVFSKEKPSNLDAQYEELKNLLDK